MIFLGSLAGSNDVVGDVGGYVLRTEFILTVRLTKYTAMGITVEL